MDDYGSDLQIIFLNPYFLQYFLGILESFKGNSCKMNLYKKWRNYAILTLQTSYIFQLVHLVFQ